MERLRVHLDEQAVRDNVRVVRRLSPAPIMAVVKGNAYGHGLLPMAALLVRHGVRHLAVNSPEEALRLRNAGLRLPITILSPTPAAAARDVVATRLRPSLSDLAAARTLNRAAARSGVPVRVHVELDTGLGRYGWPATSSGFAEIACLTLLDHLVVDGVYTHLAGSGRDELAEQARAFDHAYTRLAAALQHRPRRHVLASTGLAAGLHAAGEMIRPGALLYGLAPRDGRTPAPAGIRPVLSLTSHVVHLRRMPAGASIGYGAAHHTTAPARIAVVPAGFADGVPRQLAAGGRVLVRGQYAPIVGSVGMTHLTVDVTSVPDARVGDPVTLLGAQGPHTIEAEEWARLSGTINSDVLTRIAPSIPRAVTPLPHIRGELSA